MMVMGSSEAAEHYLPYLLEGRADDLIALFAGDPAIDDPMAGRVAGQEAIRAFAGERRAWLAARDARLEAIRTTHTPARTVVEWVLHLDHEGEAVPLPMAVVGAHGGGAGLDQVRVYHSMWPLIGEHRVREAILPADKHIELGDVIARYQRALAEGDVEAIVSTFEPDGYFREPAGSQYVYRGTEALHDFMAKILAPGGIGLEHCTATDDGVVCAIEFNAVTFGAEPLVPQAGVAVYERGESGLLHAARIYDDVNVEAYAG
jgi:hypothetical protein